MYFAEVHTVHGILKARILEWFAVPFASGPCFVRTFHQSILKEINPEYSLERLMLKFQYFGRLMRRAGSLEKTLMLGKRRRRERQRIRWLDSITDSMHMCLRKFGEIDSGGQRSLTCCSGVSGSRT